MADRIIVNTDDLRDSANALKLIDSEFSNADDNADEFSKVVGHDGLGDKIKDFSTRWEHHRNDMLKNIEALQKILSDGADKIDETDRDMAKTLTEPAQPAPAGPRKPSMQ